MYYYWKPWIHENQYELVSNFADPWLLALGWLAFEVAEVLLSYVL